MTTRLAVSLVLLSALALSACGKLGELDRPAPMFGAKAKAEYARQRAAARKAAGEGNADESATSQTNGDYTQANDGAKDPALQPLRTDPVPGVSGGPNAGRGTGGVLPDPYANPNSAPR